MVYKFRTIICKTVIWNNLKRLTLGTRRQVTDIPRYTNVDDSFQTAKSCPPV